MSNVVIDTNILVYGIDEDSMFYPKSRAILEGSDKSLFTTSKNISEFLTVITREPPKGYGFKATEALNILIKITDGVKILFPTEESFSIFKQLFRQYKPYGLKMYDLEIASMALAHNISDLATVNEKDFDYIKEIRLIAL
jgi:predicted nucleic acid-binding protein